MTETQKIVYKQALEKLASGIKRQDIVSSANFSFNRDEKGEPKEKYKDWPKESDLMQKELKEALHLLKLIAEENKI